MHPHATHIKGVATGAHLCTAASDGTGLHLHHRLWRRLRLTPIQAFHRRQIHRGAHHPTTNRQLKAVIGDGQHICSLAEGEQAHAIPHRRTPTRLGCTPFRGWAVMVFQAA